MRQRQLREAVAQPFLEAVVRNLDTNIRSQYGVKVVQMCYERLPGTVNTPLATLFVLTYLFLSVSLFLFVLFVCLFLLCAQATSPRSLSSWVSLRRMRQMTVCWRIMWHTAVSGLCCDRKHPCQVLF